MRRHLLDIESLTLPELESYLVSAQQFVEVSERDIKKVPALRGKTIINLFLEASTRTRTSFEIAAKRLSADAINISAQGSSVSKGETLIDTARTLEAMTPNAIVIRHRDSGAAALLAKHTSTASIINAGDGQHEHPTQALLDLLTLKQHFGDRGIRNLKIAIVGDVRHSRVARSHIWAHRLLGNEVRLVGPETLIPPDFKSAFAGNVELHTSLSSGVKDADVVMCLRLQLERQAGNFVPSLEEYSREFGVGETLLARNAPNAVVLHPGPANRGIEISSDLIDGPRSLVARQVTNGVAVRMAVLFHLLTGGENAST